MSKKLKRKVFDVELYRWKMAVYAEWEGWTPKKFVRDAAKFLGRKKPDKDFRRKAKWCGGLTSYYPRNRCAIYVKSSSADLGTIFHECLHAAVIMLNTVKVDLDVEGSHEALSYAATHVFEKTCELLDVETDLSVRRS